MKIAIVSDIHDHVWNLERALPAVRQAEAVLCCGDLCSPFVLTQLADEVPAPIHVVFGNNDGDRYRLASSAARYGHVHLHDTFFRGEIGEVRVAMSHYPDVADALDGAAVDLIAFGHDHTFRVDVREGAFIVDPGALMGYRPTDRRDVPATFAVYDHVAKVARGYRIASSGEVEPYDEDRG